MGFNIKNNYGPNIEVNDGGKVTLVQGRNGLWHTESAEEAEYEELTEAETQQPAPTDAEEVSKRAFAAAVINAAQVDNVVTMLSRLMEGKTKPKDVLMPVRSAMEAGVIRRPTWEEFCSEFGKDKIKSKASFSDYTNPENTPYDGADFELMKDMFRVI